MGNSAKKHNNNTNKKNIKKTNNTVSKNSQDSQNKNGKKKGFWKRHRKLAIVLKVLITLFILMMIIGAGAIIAIVTSDKWDVTEDDLKFTSEDTIIYDKDGNEIANVSGDEKRRPVLLSEVPQYLKDAYISIEDERFYSHNGVDIKRTVASTIRYILNRGNSSAGGGSTITQQTVKNSFKDKSDSGFAGVERKIREISRAYKLEKLLSKDQILELYLNTSYFGDGYYCVAEASRGYYKKEPKNMNRNEASMLAGIPNAPSAYCPTKHLDLAKKRQNQVLDKMVRYEFITAKEKEEILNESNAVEDNKD